MLLHAPDLRWCVAAALAALGIASTTAAQSPSELRLRDDQRVQRVLDDYAAILAEEMEKQRVPGLAVALVDRDGIVWARAFGHTTRDGTRPVDTKTIFSVQSISKAVTATAVLTAVRDGLVDLDEPITTYLPSFTVQSAWERHPERRMTLRHLLSHRAGFTHEAPMGNNYDPRYPSFEEYIRSISRTWLRFPVGRQYSYANLGVDLAGHLLAVKSGASFPEVMARRVLGPLSMSHSSYDWDVIHATENRAVGHWEGYDSVPGTFALIPSGGLYASVEDLATFVRFHLNRGRVNGRPLLSEAELREMYTVQFADPEQVEGYGLGLGRYRRYRTHHHNHNGGGFGFQAHMAWYPEYGFGVVVLTNANGHNLTNRHPYALVDRILEAVLGEIPWGPAPYQHLTPAEAAPSVGRRVLGTYIGRGFEVNIALRGDTVGMAMGSQFAPLHFTAEREAYMEPGPSRWWLRFTLDDDGRPRSLTRVNDGTVLSYNDGPDFPAGPDKPSWTAYEGTYTYSVWGQRTVENRVQRRNGYLYFNELRLEEHLPGLFFSVDGEALDLRGEPPTWRNVRLERLP